MAISHSCNQLDSSCSTLLAANDCSRIFMMPPLLLGLRFSGATKTPSSDSSTTASKVASLVRACHCLVSPNYSTALFLISSADSAIFSLLFTFSIASSIFSTISVNNLSTSVYSTSTPLAHGSFASFALTSFIIFSNCSLTER